MNRRALPGLAGFAIAVAFAAATSPALAKTAPTPGAFIQASALAPSNSGPSQAQLSALAINARQLAQAKAGANAAAAGAHKPSGGGGGGTGGAPIVNSYANVSPSFNGSYQTGVTPPDTTGAIGPDRYIETVNTVYGIYSRTGGLINNGTLSALTGVSGGLFGYSLSDPQMIWDQKTQRFYYSAVFYDLFLSNIGLAVGWSKTATPASSSDFCKFAIGFGSELPDYPKLGDSRDFLMYGYNLFGNGATTYDGSEFAVLNKPGPGTTCPSTSSFQVTFSPTLHNGDGSFASTPVPANLVDDNVGTGTGYVVANPDLTSVASSNVVSIWSVDTQQPVSGIPQPIISGVKTATVPDAYSIPANAPEAGSSYRLDTLDGRFEAATAAVDPDHGSAIALWTAHAVAHDGGGGSEERWYEINPSTSPPTLLQWNKVTSPSLYIWNGAIAPDRNGAAGVFGNSWAMSVSTSSTTTYPAIQFLSQRGGSGLQTNPQVLVQATGPSVDFSCSSTAACRWGDYSGASADPASSTSGPSGRVWLGNQYNLAGGSASGTSWRTRIFGVQP